MQILAFFRGLFGKKQTRSWNLTPEAYLGFVLYFQKKNSGSYDRDEVLQWGDILMKVMKVNLRPYRDFNDLLEHGKPDTTAIDKVDQQLKEINQRIELKKAIYGENADLGDDNVMTSNSKESIAAREFVNDLSKYVRFKDQDKSDDEV